MCAKMAFQHQAGTAMECLSVCIFQLKWILRISCFGNTEFDN